MDRWDAEPHWAWWQHQMDLMTPPPAPDAETKALAGTLAQLLRGQARGAHGQQLGALRHGTKHWKRRR